MVLVGPFEEGVLCLQHHCALHKHLHTFYLMFGRHVVLPVDLMCYTAPKSEDPATYAAQLKHALMKNEAEVPELIL